MTKLKNWWTKLFKPHKKDREAVLNALSSDSYEEALNEVKADLENHKAISRELRKLKFKVLSGEKLTKQEKELLKIYD